MKGVNRSFSLMLFLVLAFAVINCAGSRTQESTGEYVDDSVITTKVKAQLVADQGLKGFSIEVETFKGVVQLSGFVDTEEQAQRAEDIAESVDDVIRVENDIIVKGESGY